MCTSKPLFMYTIHAMSSRKNVFQSKLVKLIDFGSISVTSSPDVNVNALLKYTFSYIQTHHHPPQNRVTEYRPTQSMTTKIDLIRKRESSLHLFSRIGFPEMTSKHTHISDVIHSRVLHLVVLLIIFTHTSHQPSAFHI